MTMQRIHERLRDYGKIYQGEPLYPVTYPASLDDVQSSIRFAASNGLRIRVRGSGHTFNGCTLPRLGELLIRTDALNYYRFEDTDSIIVGAGALVWDVRDLVADYGMVLPVFNGGWAGPTIGGFINAGGFGKGQLSQQWGGLWENVSALTLVDGRGEVRHITRDDEVFPWCFGAYGQFGVLVEAEMDLVNRSADSVLKILSQPKGRIPKRQAEDPGDNDRLKGVSEEKLIWFSLLVRPQQEAAVWQAMSGFCDRHKLVATGGWAGPIRNGEPMGYRYDIAFHTFNPPLLYARNERFLVLGVMTMMRTGSPEHNKRLLRVEEDFIRLAEAEGFWLYLQAENIGNKVDLAHYYGDQIFQQFRAHKVRFDPVGLINPRGFFDVR